MKRILYGVVAVVAALGATVIAAAAFGHDPIALIAVMLRGSFGSQFAIEGTILKSVPLLLTGLSVALAFRAGVWNIGAEGQFIVGALAAMLASRWGAAAAILAAAAAGAVWASIATAMRAWRGAPEVLTTILLNFVAIHILGWAVNGPMRERAAQYPQTDPAAAALPTFGNVHSGVAVAVLLAVAAWWMLYRTREGLRLRASGLSPEASQWAGINVGAQVARAMALSGALAGVAGSIELLGVTHRLFERFATGYGYSGIAVALLAALHPLAILLSALFFGALVSGAGELQRSAGIASSIAVFAQAVVILAVLALSAVRGRRSWT